MKSTLKTTLTLFLFTLSPLVFATAYTVKIELALNGQSTQSEILVKSGERASISQDSKGGIQGKEKTFIEVSAKEQKPTEDSSPILLNFVIGRIGTDDKRTILASPQMIVLENKKATISMKNKEKSADDLSLSVLTIKKL